MRARYWVARTRHGESRKGGSAALWRARGEVAKEYAASSNDDARQVATALASDRFIAYSTWKWIDLASVTGGKPVYQYYYSRPRPAMKKEAGNVTAGLAGGVVAGPATATPPPVPKGAVHSAEIEYALGNLDGNHFYAWSSEDRKVSGLMDNTSLTSSKPAIRMATAFPSGPP